MAAGSLNALGKNGRYRLVEEIGAGGMATVHRAEDTVLRREVAVKLLYPHLLRDPAGKARFLREARAAAGLDHPGILKIFDVDEGDDGTPFIVMELLRGRSLKAFVDENGPPLAEIVALAGAALADALATAHDAGVVHRDVKPANVMVCAGGRLVLCDFGVARVADDDALATQSGALVGTPSFMSPEQALGRRADALSDVYSLGATLYQMATGAPPFSGSAASVLQQVLRGDVVAPGRRNPTVGGELSSLIEAAMAREPTARPASAREVARALAEQAAASGCGDAKAELAAYFEDPGGWNQRTLPRIVEETAGRARAAFTAGRVARALSLADRVLSLDPAHAGARSLVARAGVAARRRRQGRVLLFAAAGLATAGIGLAVYRMRERVVVPTPAPVDTRPDAAVVTRAAPDAGGRPAPPDAGAREAARVASPDAGPRVRVRRSPDAGVRVAAAIVPDAAPPPAGATVDVKIRPWCDIEIDGERRGRSPRAPAIELTPGRHHLVCAQSGTDRALERDLDLAPGQRLVIKEDLFGEIAVRVGITGSAVRVDGKPAAAGATLSLAPGVHRVEVGGSPATYVHIPTHPCTLKDTPVLDCYEQ